MNWMDMNHAMLPQAVWLPVWITLSWALVASAVGLRLTSCAKPRWWPAALMLGVMCLPFLPLGGYLALAFQTPSLVLVAWSVWCWSDVLQRRASVATTPTPVALLGVVLGWALVVDTLNAWPAFFNPQLYALGFEAVGLWLVLGTIGVLLLWTPPPTRWVGSAVTVLAVYVLLRWPTGNVWDALLDPFVWLTCHVHLWRAWRQSRT